MSRWLSAVLVVPLLVVSVLAATVVRAQNEIYNSVISSTEVAVLATHINQLDQALGAEALAGRRVIDDPSLWDEFDEEFARQTDLYLAALERDLETVNNPSLEQAIYLTKDVLGFREDMPIGLVSPLQLADRYSIPRTELLDVLRENEQQVALQRLIALIEARSAHLDERFSTELALTYGTWAPGQYNQATGALAIQADRIRTTDNGRSPDFLAGNTDLSDFRDRIQLTPDIPDISTSDFADASDMWLVLLNDEIDVETQRITSLLDERAANAVRVRLYTIAGVFGGVLLAFLAAGLISYRIVRRVGLIADFAQRFGSAKASSEQLSQVVAGRDELADLAIVFDEMAGEVRQRDQRLAAQAQVDDLTKILNRRAAISRWATLLERSSGNAFAFVIDLDGFKSINDRFGHHAGDVVLVEVASRLRETIEDYRAVVGRTGGDEFLAVFDQPEALADDPTVIAERMLEAVRRPIEVEGATVSVDATIGIVRSRRDGSTAAQLLRDADAALYKAKSSGRGRVLESDEDLRKQLAAADQLHQAVIQALDNQEFEPWFQSIWDDAGQLVGFEALARWQSADGLYGTESFIEVLGDQQLLHVLDASILRSACAAIAQWSANAVLPPMVSVNISTGFLEQYGFVSIVQDLLDEFDIEPSTLVLEVTESGLMTNAASNADRLQQLRDVGVRVAVDDYGTGYSSLSYLRQLPIDFVKLDRQFVTSVDSNPKNQAIARSVIALTTDLGMRSIVEGVERPEEHEWLVTNGADLLQGYFLGLPLSEGDASALLRIHDTKTERSSA